MRETFFRPFLQPYPAALRKFAWPLWWRGRKYSSWYLHQNVPAAPAHPWVLPREREGWSYMYTSTDGSESHPYPRFLSGVSAYAADRCRSFISSIGPQADERNLGVIFRGCLCPGQGIDLVVGAVFSLTDAIVVVGVQRPIFYAVQHLLLFGFSQYGRQGVAEIHSTDFLTLCGADLCFSLRSHTAYSGEW